MHACDDVRCLGQPRVCMSMNMKAQHTIHTCRLLASYG